MRLITYKRRDHADGVRVQRFDRAEAKLDPASRTSQGYLRAHAAVAVPGVMEYEDANGKVSREFVPPEELHNADSLLSLASVPVTLGHPDEDVTPENVGTLGVGDVGEQVDVLAESGHVRVVMVTRRKDALDAIGEGTIEVSPGYTCFVDPTPGVDPVYGAYDAIQRGRRYNHLAIVEEARGGPTVKLRADARRSVRRVDSVPPPRTGDRPMKINPLLLLLATSLGLPVQSNADGTKYVRAEGKKDAVDVPAEMTESDLLNLIVAAANKLIAMKTPATDPAAATGSGDVAALKQENADLKAEVATLKTDKANREAAEAKKADEADRKRLDVLAKKLDFDTTSWRTDTKTADRKLDLVRHKGLVAKDATPPADVVNGMIFALERFPTSHADGTDDGGQEHGDGESRRSDWADADIKDPDPQAGGQTAPASARKDRAMDPHKKGIERSRAAARGEKVA